LRRALRGAARAAAAPDALRQTAGRVAFPRKEKAGARTLRPRNCCLFQEALAFTGFIPVLKVLLMREPMLAARMSVARRFSPKNFTLPWTLRSINSLPEESLARRRTLMRVSPVTVVTCRLQIGRAHV